jgi:hypothetical protein
MAANREVDVWKDQNVNLEPLAKKTKSWSLQAG